MYWFFSFVEIYFCVSYIYSQVGPERKMSSDTQGFPQKCLALQVAAFFIPAPHGVQNSICLHFLFFSTSWKGLASDKSPLWRIYPDKAYQLAYAVETLLLQSVKINCPCPGTSLFHYKSYSFFPNHFPSRGNCTAEGRREISAIQYWLSQHHACTWCTAFERK